MHPSTLLEVDDVAPDYYDAVVGSVNAGIDMNMIPGNYPLFIENLTHAVESGDVSDDWARPT